MSIRNLDFLFRPSSVAVIGASQREQSVGGALMRNLLKAGFRGPVMPVNRTRRSVAGVHAYRFVGHLPSVPDLALVCTPPETVPELIHELGTFGARAAVILTSGMKARTGPAGETLQQAALAAAKPHMLRILGPNSMGLVVPGIGLHASFAPAEASPGRIAFVSQSGALAAAALQWAAARHIGFSYVVSLGDTGDVDAADVLDYLGSDAQTRAVLLHVESVGQGRKFLSAARATSRNKPVIVLKSGRTSAGAKAAMRHTGNHPGVDTVFEAAIARAGMLRVASMAELFAAAETLTRIRSDQAERLIIVTNAGGPGVIATDSLVHQGEELGTLDPETAERLKERLPPAIEIGNPLDLGGDASAMVYGDSLKAILAGSGQDAVLIIHGPSGAGSAEESAAACAAAASESERNVLACWMGRAPGDEPSRILQEGDIPVYETPESAVQAFHHMVRYRRNQEALQETPPSMSEVVAADVQAARTILDSASAARQRSLSGPQASALAAAYRIPVVATHVASSRDEAARIASEIGYPVALKVLSPDLEHRSEVGGVMLNLVDENEVRNAADDIERRMRSLRPDAQLSGFTVQRMIRPLGAVHMRPNAHALALEAVEDSVFGPVIYLLPAGSPRDANAVVGLLPLNAALARNMLLEAPVRAQLGQTADLAALGMVLVCVSQMFAAHPELKELALDPLLVDDKGVMALEVRGTIGASADAGGKRFSIPLYPRELEQMLELKGRQILVRPIRPQDAGAYAQFIARTDAPDAKFRFFNVIRNVPSRQLARYTQIDYERDMAFVAVTRPEKGESEILGEVRAYGYADGATAEFAILVRSNVKRQGLGRLLLDKLIDHCRSRGTAEMIGLISPENDAMLGLARSCGMEIEKTANMAIAHMDLRRPAAAPTGIG